MTRWIMTCLKVMEAVDDANPGGIGVLIHLVGPAGVLARQRSYFKSIFDCWSCAPLLTLQDDKL